MSTYTPNTAAIGDAPNGHPILAAGPLTKQPHTNPYRTVLIDWGDKYSVHRQYWMDHPEPPPGGRTAGSALESGNYFEKHGGPAAAFRDAIAVFANRVSDDAGSASTVFRNAA